MLACQYRWDTYFAILFSFLSDCTLGSWRQAFTAMTVALYRFLVESTARRYVSPRRFLLSVWRIGTAYSQVTCTEAKTGQFQRPLAFTLDLQTIGKWVEAKTTKHPITGGIQEVQNDAHEDGLIPESVPASPYGGPHGSGRKA